MVGGNGGAGGGAVLDLQVLVLLQAQVDNLLDLDN